MDRRRVGRRLNAVRLRPAALQTALGTCALIVALLVAALAGPHASAVAKDTDADAAAAIAGENTRARIALAKDLAKKDVAALVRAFDALGGRKVKRGEDVTPDLDFLAQYVVSQPARALRMMAIDAGARLDAEAFAARIRAMADGEDRLRSALAAEALGLTGSADDVPRLLELARSPSISVAVRACRAVARIGKKKDGEALIEIALDHDDPEVGDHATWAAQDLLKTQKAVLGKMKKLAGKDPAAPRALRHASLEAMLADHLKPFKWEPTLENARELLLAAPAEITINCRDAKRKKLIGETVAWIAENMPGAYLLVRASAESIDVPADPPAAHVDLEKRIIGVPLSYTSQTPKKLAYHIIRVATVLYEMRVGHPYRGHRGWENAIFDSYEVCGLAGLYGVGQGGMNRDRFLLEILSKRPWGGS